jgi:hypothetical protein
MFSFPCLPSFLASLFNRSDDRRWFPGWRLPDPAGCLAGLAPQGVNFRVELGILAPWSAILALFLGSGRRFPIILRL